MNEPLLAVILATSSSRGSHIVFRWPNNPKVLKRYSKVKYFADRQHVRMSKDRSHDDDLDPISQKAKWQRHDEDDDDDDVHQRQSEYGQSDTHSSSGNELDSDDSASDDDDVRSVGNRADTVISNNAKSRTSRSKSKTRKPILTSIEDSTHSLRSADRPAPQPPSAQPHNHIQGADSDVGVSHQLSPEEKARRLEKAAQAYKNYLGYQVAFLASILNPKKELAHQKFELVIDDLAFLGHPVCVGKSGKWGPPQDDQQHEYGHDQDPQQPPAFKSVPTQKTPSQDQPATSAPNKAFAPLTQFHLVLVLDRPDPSLALSGMDLSSWLQLFYDNIVFKMTAALFAEQARSDYVAKEADKLLALRERCMDDGQSYSAYMTQCLGISSLARCLRDMHRSISVSSDACLMINDRIEVHLQLPPILQQPEKMFKISDIETELDPNDPIFLSGAGFAGLGKEGVDQDGDGGNYERLMSLSPHQLTFEEWTRTTGPYLLPWKTLLLLHDHPDDDLPRDRAEFHPEPSHEANGFEQFTRKFTALFRPRVSDVLNFSQVADMLGWDLYDDVYPMVRHLIYYRQARVIDVPRTGHVYSISSLFDFKRLPCLSSEWAQSFVELPSLVSFLSSLSSAPRPLNSQLPGRYQRQLCLDVLIWLLRREIIVKLHVRLRLIVTESIKRRAAEKRIERSKKLQRRKEKLQRRKAREERNRLRQQAKEERRKMAKAENGANNKELEQRGRSRDRDRSKSVDARRIQNRSLSGQQTRQQEQIQVQDMKPSRSVGQIPPSASGLSITRSTMLSEGEFEKRSSTAEAGVSQSSDKDNRHHHHHHHHHHQHHHSSHHSHRRRFSETVRDKGPGQSSGALKAGGGSNEVEQLKFERRAVLRSRSPSTVLSISFSNAVEGDRQRAGTNGSSSNSTGGSKVDSLSMTPNTIPSGILIGPSGARRGSFSRPGTPRGRVLALHVRDRETGSSNSPMTRANSVASSLVDGGNTSGGAAPSSVPLSAVLSRKGRMMSRSPSRARLRIRGFGEDEEVEIDDDEAGEDGNVNDQLDLAVSDEPQKEATAPLDDVDPNGSPDVYRRLSLVGEEDDDVVIQKEGGNGKGDHDHDDGPERLSPVANMLPRPFRSRSSRRHSHGHRHHHRHSQQNSTSGTESPKLRRISVASERPDLPPPCLTSPISNNSLSFSCSSSGTTVSGCISSSCSASEDESEFEDQFDFESDDEICDQDDDPFDLKQRMVDPELLIGDTLIIEPSRASRQENEWISVMVEGQDPSATKKFFRLLPYLNGKHTIDEIEFRVRMKRKEIRKLLSTFKDNIITFMHP